MTKEKFGNVGHFWYPDQVVDSANSNHIDNNCTILTSNIKCSDHIVNICYEPKVVSEVGFTLPFDLLFLKVKMKVRLILIHLLIMSPLSLILMLMKKPYSINLVLLVRQSVKL